MKLPVLSLATLAVVGGAWLVSSAPVSTPAPIEYTFRSAPINSMGVKSLSELLGKPVMIEFWGTR